jgi:hypothetical protein
MNERVHGYPVQWEAKKGGITKWHYTWRDMPNHTLCGHSVGERARRDKVGPLYWLELVMCRACFYLMWSGAAEFYRSRREGQL